jgi:hypothetical protein
MMGVAAVLDLWRRYHEVSILIAAGLGVGRASRPLERSHLTFGDQGLEPKAAAFRT